MKLITAFFFSTFTFHFLAAQSQDSVLFKIVKIDSSIETSLYRLHALNISTKPYCIYHSGHIIPHQNPTPLLLKLYDTESVETFSLNYSLKDSQRDHYYDSNYLNGHILLPYQNLDFDFTISNSSLRQLLKVKLTRLNDFCYNDFVARRFANSTNWHDKYQKEEIILEIPRR